MQTYEKVTYIPSALVKKLEQVQQIAQNLLWRKFKVILKDDPSKRSSGKQARLLCLQCNEDLSPSNVHRTFREHFDGSGKCKKHTMKQEQAAKQQKTTHAEGAAQDNQQTLDRLLLPAAVRDAAMDDLAAFLCKHSAPSAVEDPHLISCLNKLGCPPPSAWVMRNTTIPNLYTKTMAEMKQAVGLAGVGLIGGMSSDGWKKKAAEQGVPLINFNLLLPDGGSKFLGIVTARGAVKDAQWIYDLHVDMAKKWTDNKPERLVGMVMDGTKANRKAQGMLRTKYPSMMQIGCQAHSLSLFVKDLANSKKTSWFSAVMARALMMVNCINDNERLKSHVHQQQQQLYNKIKGFSAPCPTRFGNHVISVRDLVASKSAIKQTALDDNWGSISSSCRKADQFQRAASTPKHWKEFEAIVGLLQPIVKAIHTIEADRPLLSQMLTLYNSIDQHLEDYMDKHDDTPGAVNIPDDVLQLWQERKVKHWHDEFYAAHLLDPINFKQRSADMQWTPPCADLSSAALNKALAVLTRLAECTTTAQKNCLAEEWANYRLQCLSSDLAGLMPALQIKRERKPRQGGRGQGNNAGPNSDSNAASSGSNGASDAAEDEEWLVTVPAVGKRREFWLQYGAREYPLLAKAAERLLNMHVTTCASERNWSLWGKVYTKDRNRLSISLGEKIVFIRGNLASAVSETAAEVSLAELVKPAEVAGAAVAGS